MCRPQLLIVWCRKVTAATSHLPGCNQEIQLNTKTWKYNKEEEGIWTYTPLGRSGTAGWTVWFWIQTGVKPDSFSPHMTHLPPFLTWAACLSLSKRMAEGASERKRKRKNNVQLNSYAVDLPQINFTHHGSGFSWTTALTFEKCAFE